MANRLPIPDELQHLIEKRGSPDRRKDAANAADIKSRTPKTAPTKSGSAAERRKRGRRKTD